MPWALRRRPWAATEGASVLLPGTASAGGAGPTSAGQSVGEAGATAGVHSGAPVASSARSGVAGCGTGIGASSSEGAGVGWRGEGGCWEKGRTGGPLGDSCGVRALGTDVGVGGPGGLHGATPLAAHGPSSWGWSPSSCPSTASSSTQETCKGSGWIFVSTGAMAPSAGGSARKGSMRGVRNAALFNMATR